MFEAPPLFLENVDGPKVLLLTPGVSRLLPCALQLRYKALYCTSIFVGYQTNTNSVSTQGARIRVYHELCTMSTHLTLLLASTSCRTFTLAHNPAKPQLNRQRKLKRLLLSVIPLNRSRPCKAVGRPSMLLIPLNCDKFSKGGLLHSNPQPKRARASSLRFRQATVDPTKKNLRVCLLAVEPGLSGLRSSLLSNFPNSSKSSLKTTEDVSACSQTSFSGWLHSCRPSYPVFVGPRLF